MFVLAVGSKYFNIAKVIFGDLIRQVKQLARGESNPIFQGEKPPTFIDMGYFIAMVY